MEGGPMLPVMHEDGKPPAEPKSIFRVKEPLVMRKVFWAINRRW
jgi:hypothetical protein